MIFKAPEKNAILKSGYGINSTFFQYIHPCSLTWWLHEKLFFALMEKPVTEPISSSQRANGHKTTLRGRKKIKDLSALSGHTYITFYFMKEKSLQY